jgi:hypothetical protein
MGRSSVEATNACLIRAVRAILWALVPRRRLFRRAAAAFPALADLPLLFLEEEVLFFV